MEPQRRKILDESYYYFSNPNVWSDIYEHLPTFRKYARECDTIIVERFGVTGELPTNVRQPIMADFIEALDYQDALNAIQAANEAFMEMPAGIRARFENNPHNFVEFFSKEENREEGVKLGLIEPKASLKQEAKDGQGGETPPQ